MGLERTTSNKVLSSESSTLLLIFRTNKVLEGCSPYGCSPATVPTPFAIL
ncbi:hypothetical protein HanRHA438_Chr04g0188981 [Helianthus annuus]|nr:hypothetical protein HanRHA438_Chr04g0188981 [Helianthus annuus]